MLLQYFFFVKSAKNSIHSSFNLLFEMKKWNLKPSMFCSSSIFLLCVFFKSCNFFFVRNKNVQNRKFLFFVESFFQKVPELIYFLIRRKPHLFASPSVKLDCWLAGWLAGWLVLWQVALLFVCLLLHQAAQFLLFFYLRWRQTILERQVLSFFSYHLGLIPVSFFNRICPN